MVYLEGDCLMFGDESSCSETQDIIANATVALGHIF